MAGDWHDKTLDVSLRRDYIFPTSHQKGGGTAVHDKRGIHVVTLTSSTHLRHAAVSGGGSNMRWNKVERVGLLAALLAMSWLWLPITATAVDVGEKAPDFLLHSTVGETQRLSDYQGKKNVLLFFFFRAFGGV
jgi:hypothetical protein